MLELSQSTLAVALLAMVLFGSAWAWARWTKALREQRELLTYEPRRPVPWGIIDLGAVLLIMACTQSLAAWIALRSWGSLALGELSVDKQARFLALNSLASITMWLLSVLFIRLRCKATSRDLGETPWRFQQDLQHGAQGFFMIVIPVYAIQFVLMQFLKPEHPLIKLLMENGSLPFFLVSGVMAVLVAPVVEEYLFRVILQGWLENLAVARQAGVSPDQRMKLILGHPPLHDATLGSTASTSNSPAGNQSDVLAHHITDNPYAPPGEWDDNSNPNSRSSVPVMKPAWWPIFSQRVPLRDGPRWTRGGPCPNLRARLGTRLGLSADAPRVAVYCDAYAAERTQPDSTGALSECRAMTSRRTPHSCCRTNRG